MCLVFKNLLNPEKAKWPIGIEAPNKAESIMLSPSSPYKPVPKSQAEPTAPAPVLTPVLIQGADILIVFWVPFTTIAVAWAPWTGRTLFVAYNLAINSPRIGNPPPAQLPRFFDVASVISSPSISKPIVVNASAIKFFLS